MEKQITGRTCVEVRDKIVAREHFAKDAQGFTRRRKREQTDGGKVREPLVGLMFVEERAFKLCGIEPRDNLAHIQALGVGVVAINASQKKNPHSTHALRM